MITTIARPADAQDALFYRWPAKVAPGSTLTCGPSEVAVFSEEGRIVGTVGPGHHAVSPAAMPFLQMAGSGDLQVLFVTSTPVSLRFGCKLPAMKDAATGLPYEARAFGTVFLKVEDTAKFATQVDAETEPEQVLQFLKSKLGPVIAEALAQARPSLLELVTPEGAQKVADAAVSTPEFESFGVDIDAFEQITLSVDDDVLEKAKAAKAKPAPAAAPVAHASASACAACGAALLANARFCAGCGQPAARSCPKCKKPQLPAAKFCDDCGSRI